MEEHSTRGILVGYARTSTAEQEAGLLAQIRDLEVAGCSKIFREQVSSISQRKELERALEYVRGGDTLIVTKVDRLARSTTGLWDIVKRLEDVEDGGVALRVLNLGGEVVDTKSATGKLILTIFAGFAQFEREMMLERQKEGIAKAKAEKRYPGRKPTARAKAGDAVALFKQGLTVTEIAEALSIGRASVYRALEEAGLKQKTPNVQQGGPNDAAA
jgi:DNA invertase Pin-like site-specific DNA recombinase